MEERPARSARAAVVLLLLALLGSGCWPSAGAPEAARSGRPGTATPTPGRYERYVALGDSYSAGPFVPTTDLAGGCLRSDHDYPHLLAQRLRVRRLVDVTCSGARTADLIRPQRPFPGSRVPPQLRPVTSGTDLVTVGIGGNDLDLFGTVVRTCTGLRGRQPAGAPCTEELRRRGFDVARAGATITRRVAAGLRAVRRRAPAARVLLVGYLRVVPARGGCRALPLATGDYPLGRRVAATLDAALRRAARRAGVSYVDMDAASRGHDVCAARPWVNGSVTDRSRALAYHPLLAGMRADARQVLRVLAQDDGG